jgi:hypothetical protein
MKQLTRPMPDIAGGRATTTYSSTSVPDDRALRPAGSNSTPSRESQSASASRASIMLRRRASQQGKHRTSDSPQGSGHDHSDEHAENQADCRSTSPDGRRTDLAT